MTDTIAASTTPPREALLERLGRDLIGPGAADEVILDRPSDRYLTGILFPRDTPLGQAESEELATGEDEEEPTSTATEGVSLSNVMKPASAGVSFAIGTSDERPTVDMRVRCGTYKCILLGPDGEPLPLGSQGPRKDQRWRRTDHDVLLSSVRLGKVEHTIDLGAHDLKGLELYVRIATSSRGQFLITAALVNRSSPEPDRVAIEESSFFQVELTILPSKGSKLLPRPSRKSGVDEDGRSAQLIYREASEFAVGHTCSAAWDLAEKEVTAVRTSWMPRAIVPSTSPEGDKVFRALSNHPTLRPLSAEWLADASAEELRSGLTMLPEAYGNWIREQEGRIESLGQELRPTAIEHVRRCREAIRRMNDGIELLVGNSGVRAAFRLANKAMQIQTRWTKGRADLTWRPFQLGFQLLGLASVAGREHADRRVMDLLWFPTGGGKTEAYLALTAFVMFLRRLRDKTAAGHGVSVLMRYTLRLLTIQQFQRASALICACEYLRRGREVPKGLTPDLGRKEFSIGLWVGGNATPNDFEIARTNLRKNEDPTPKQLTTCPACCAELDWTADATARAIKAACKNGRCEYAATGEHVPIWTVDSDIYRERPSLIIGTVDKFAQLARNLEAGNILGCDRRNDPPDLIIQDELHLISGPLGTLAGLYEIAIDELCSAKGWRPKIIGSTATIRRAADQISHLFDREAFQFPPPALDADNSCFAMRDTVAPGRLYVGLSTAGRSPKFALQALCASLLQGATDPAIPQTQRDYYWTLVAYFNSLRELGGALVLMLDDVGVSIRDYARRRGEEPRPLKAPGELTSRRRSSEIPEILETLQKKAGDSEALDALLASNMISVGVDIPRLGLMVVNGQPKGIAEYIQATSRVGRSDVPGLIVTLYNNARARDRSFFETFPGWHSTLYRDVEATSVTPFASRARDKALHAVLVILVRHGLPTLSSNPKLTAATRKLCDSIAKTIVARAERTDAEERPGVATKLQQLLDEWEATTDLSVYWDNHGKKTALMMSAEQHAALLAYSGSVPCAWATPNSMREVEPGTPFLLVERLRIREGNDGAQE